MRFISKSWVSRGDGFENFIVTPKLARLVGITLGIVAGFFSPPASAQEPILAGYRDFNYGSTVVSTPTAEKPESKLWWNDGYWWGSLWDPVANNYRIHRFDVAAQSWISVGPDIDDRPKSLGDALWDGQKLFVASHIYAGGSQQSGDTTPAKSARLYRYSYDPTADTYSLDAGFPVLVNSAESETLVLDKDSTGQLWVTWTQANKVYVNRSLGDDLTWGTPFVLPVQGSDLDEDDISTIIAFDGNKIGVMWSNQIDLKVYFAVHLDNNADTNWEPREVALVDANGGAVADDHLNVKVMAADGNLYAVTKTSLNLSSGPRIYALKRTPGGVWTKHVVAIGSTDYTRPIVMLDDENDDMYVFASDAGIIRMKKVSLSDINFPAGDGEAFIRSSVNKNIDNPASAKHNVNSTTGLLVVASTQRSHYYFHNYINLPTSGSPTITSFTPASGLTGTLVTITGNNFNGATGVAFGGTAATSFTIDSNTQITATVPAGATSGKISVTQSAGTALSVSNFFVQYTLATNAAGAGSVAPSGGVYNAGTVVTLTATPDPGYEFGGWSGDLSGSTNPATITMDADKNVTATFTAIQHTLTVNTAGSGNVALNPPGGTYDVGTEVTLTATPNSGYQFSGWSGDLTGSTNPATITMDGDKNVTATFTEIPWSGPIVHEESQTGGSAGSATVTTAASLTGVGGNLYLAAISTQPRVGVLAVSGLGLSWTLVRKQCAALNSTDVELWMAQGIPQGGSSGAVTATLASAPSAAVIAVSRYSGVEAVDPIGLVISGNTNGMNASATCAGGVPSDSYSFNLTTTASGAVVYGAIAMKARTHTPGAGYTERAEIKQLGSGLTSSVAVEDMGVAAAGTVPINGSFNGTADWAVVALEIKPAAIPIVHEESQTGGSAGSATVTTAASLTGVSGNLYLAAISTQPRVGVVAVSGLGLSWTLVRKQCAALNSTDVEVWMAQGIPQGGSNGAVTATLASAPSAAVIAVSRYSGVEAVDPIGLVISGNTNGMNASATCAGGVPSDSYSFNLTTTANGAVVYGAIAMKARTHTPGAGYTERAEIKQLGSGLTSSVAVEDMAVAAAGTVPINGSLNGTADWAVVTLEIKPLGASKAAMISAGETTTEAPLVSAYQLEQNYPNPFWSAATSRFAGNPSTGIRYSLPQAGHVRLTIYDLRGQTVSIPVNDFQRAGTYTLDWQAVDRHGHALPSGVYFYRLEAGSIVVTKRMTLLR